MAVMWNSVYWILRPVTCRSAVNCGQVGREPCLAEAGNIGLVYNALFGRTQWCGLFMPATQGTGILNQSSLFSITRFYPIGDGIS